MPKKPEILEQRVELREWNPDQWKHPIECNRCGDDGYLKHLVGFRRCDCDAGRNLDERFLKLLNETAAAAAENANKPTRTDAPIRPSAVEIARVMHRKRERGGK